MPQRTPRSSAAVAGAPRAFAFFHAPHRSSFTARFSFISSAARHLGAASSLQGGFIAVGPDGERVALSSLRGGATLPVVTRVLGLLLLRPQ